MTRILVLYYSMYGHIERMAQAVAQGVGEAAGCEVALKRVPETMDEARSREAGAKLDQAAPIASPEELGDYDALILGTPTRYGNMTGQMRAFWTRPAASGPAAPWSARSAAPLPAPPPSTAARRRP